MSCLFFSSFYFIFPSFPFSLLEIRSANSDWREFSRFQAMSWTSKTVSELRSSRSITQLQLGTPPLSGSRYLSYEKRWIYEVHIHERCSFYGLLRTDRGTIWWWRDSWGRERKDRWRTITWLLWSRKRRTRLRAFILKFDGSCGWNVFSNILTEKREHLSIAAVRSGIRTHESAHQINHAATSVHGWWALPPSAQ